MTTVTEMDPRQVLRSQVRAHFFEFRAAEPGDGEPGDGRTLEGYAAVFDQPTVIESYAGSFEETVARGAFRKTLRERKPVMQFDHGNDKRVGTAPIGSIDELHEDDAGLFVRGRLLDTERVEDIRQAIAVGAIRGMSFKFRVMQDRWIDRDGKKIRDDELSALLEDPGERGPIRREITEVQLFELGPVVFPAYEQTSVNVRSGLPAGSPFNPNALALRGVIAQFGLDARCIKRHLGVFDADARRALAEEIAGTFPELLEVLAARAATPPADQPPAEGGPQTSAEPAPEATPQPQSAEPTAEVTHQRSRSTTEPVARHSVRTRRGTPSWYLAPRKR